MPCEFPQSLLDALTRCAKECDSCGYTVCVGHPDMAECARFCFDCATICWTTASFVSRSSCLTPMAAAACAEVCDACATECEKFDNAEMRRCAEACRRCADECRNALKG